MNMEEYFVNIIIVSMALSQISKTIVISFGTKDHNYVQYLCQGLLHVYILYV